METCLRVGSLLCVTHQVLIGEKDDSNGSCRESDVVQTLARRSVLPNVIRFRAVRLNVISLMPIKKTPTVTQHIFIDISCTKFHPYRDEICGKYGQFH
jgi:hypothetical protein